jgi:hypothetical protein
MPRKRWPGPATQQQERALASLAAVAVSERQVAAERLRLIHDAIEMDIPTRAIAQALGVTPGRVSQIATRPTLEEPIDFVSLADLGLTADDVRSRA